VALIIKYKDASYFKALNRKDLNFNPGTMIVKLFKNIPKGDLEMLFPNAQVGMKLKDKLLMGGFALGGRGQYSVADDPFHRHQRRGDPADGPGGHFRYGGRGDGADRDRCLSFQTVEQL
jgi:hypothetical protein